MKTRPLTLALVALVAFCAGTLFPARALTQPPQREGAYMRIDFMKVAPGKGADYLAFERDLWMPVHRERMKSGRLRSWALYGRRFPAGSDTPYNYATITTYDKWQDLDDPILEHFKKAHPNVSTTEASRRTTEARDLVRGEVWDVIERLE
jgi:hypothetical protein